MQIKTIHTQKALSPTQISLADYVINPYRGCEFGCVYCYSRENKNTHESFSETIGVKVNIAQVLERELHYTRPNRVLLGSTTECFQYQENNFKLSQQVLTTLGHYNVPYTILTKSHLIRSHLPLIAQSGQNKVYFTFNCAKDKVIRTLERSSPDIASRIATLEDILARGIQLRVHIGPYVPYLSDIDQIVKLLPSGVKEIDVEVYQHSMGNFEAFLACICRVDRSCAAAVREVYQCERNYLAFTGALKNKLLQIKKDRELNIFYIVPGYNSFYSPEIDYTHSL